MSRSLGLDVGARRIGVAVSDEEGTFAQPLEVIEAGDLARAQRRILELAAEHEVTIVVLGLPLSLSGGDQGISVARVRRLAQDLSSRFEGRIELFDERLSTTAAERMLVAAGVRRNRRREVVDKVAAAIILQAYLDAARSR